MADLMLSYSYLTEPGILQASNPGRLTIIVSNAKAPFTLKGIDFVLHEGTGARDIVNGVTPTTPSLPDGWSHPTPTGGKFSMSPAAPYQIGREGLVFVFDLTVNTVVGTAIIDIVEHVEVGDAPQANRGTLAVPKFPRSFKLSGFYSATPIVNQGDSLTLVWTGENLHLANYRLSYSSNGQTKVVDIPAHTYTYSIDSIGASSVFYLHVRAVESPDTSITFQSSVYPITVNPAISEFWASSAVAAPGGNVTLNWRVADNVSSATITCPQSGKTWALDPAGLAKRQFEVALPAISMLAQYVFEAFEARQGSDDRVTVGSRTLSIEVTANIPFQQAGRVQFVTDKQAADLAKMDARPGTDTVVPQLIEEIFSAFKAIFPNIDFYLDWANPAANAQCFIYIDERKKVVIFGGLVRISCLYYEAFCFIVAQCVARFSGQLPVDGNKLTYIGVADFYATAMILKQVFFASLDSSDLFTGILDQMKTLFQTGISTENQKGDPGDLASNPGIPCRYKAISSGVFVGDVPGCAKGAA